MLDRAEHHYPIIHGRPIPAPRGRGRYGLAGRKGIYPFGKMEVGDCFEVPYDDAEPFDVQNRVKAAASQWAARRGGFAFITRADVVSVFCFRVA